MADRLTQALKWSLCVRGLLSKIIANVKKLSSDKVTLGEVQELVTINPVPCCLPELDQLKVLPLRNFNVETAIRLCRLLVLGMSFFFFIYLLFVLRFLCKGVGLGLMLNIPKCKFKVNPCCS